MLTFAERVRTAQLDIPNKLHSLADKISTPPQTQQALLYQSTILIYYKTVRTPQRQPATQTRPTGIKASRRIDKVDKFHQTL